MSFFGRIKTRANIKNYVRGSKEFGSDADLLRVVLQQPSRPTYIQFDDLQQQSVTGVPDLEETQRSVFALSGFLHVGRKLVPKTRILRAVVPPVFVHL